MVLKKLNKAIAVVLSFQFIFGFQPLYANSNTQMPRLGRLNIAEADPLIHTLLKFRDFPTPPPIAKNDPSLDSDPFYLRSQSWEASSVEGSEPSFVTSDQSVSITLPAAKKTWKIGRALQPFLATDEFIFFNGTKNFDEFVQKSPEGHGEGIFFASYKEVLAGASSSGPVPLYFIPMPGPGWTGGVAGFDFSAQGLIGLVNTRGDEVPLLLSDVRHVMSAERFNLQAATASTIGWYIENNKSFPNGTHVLPQPGLTAGFGVIYTGLNVNDLSKSILAQETSLNKKIVSLFRKVLASLAIPKAKADPFEMFSALDPKTMVRIVSVGEVAATAVVAAVALRLTLLRNFFAERRMKAARDDGAKPKKGGVWSVVKDSANLFPVNLAFINQAPAVWFGDIVEFMTDRGLTKYGAPDNTLMRKFLNNTIIFARNTWERLPINFWTFLMGAVLLGGTDTFFVGLQLYAFFPWLTAVIAHYMPTEGLAERFESAFASELSKNYVGNELIRNMSAYLTRGAASMSQDIQEQFLAKVTSEVIEDMKRQGRDPEAAENQAERKDRVEKGLERELRRLGFPSKDEFVYDAMTLRDYALALVGYSIPEEVEKAGYKASNFAGKNRPGLVIPSVKQAIKNLESVVGHGPTPASNLEAIALLKGSLKRMSYISQVFSTAASNREDALAQRSMLGDLREARREIMLLTYEGEGQVPEILWPASWKGASNEAIKKAASEVKKAFGSFVEGPKLNGNIFVPEKFGATEKRQIDYAYRTANEKFLIQTGTVFDPAGTPQEIEQWRQLFSEAMATKLGLYPDYDDNKDLERKVAEGTIGDVTAFIKRADVTRYLQLLNPTARERFIAVAQSRAYIRNYIRATKVDEGVPAISAGQPGRLQWLRQTRLFRVTENERKEVAANGFFKNPGHYASVKGRVILTRFARMAESVVPNDRYEMGRTALLDRNIPVLYDFKLANVRVYKRLITAMVPIYWANRFLYSMDLSAVGWTWHMVMAWGIGAPAQFMNRLFAAQGWRPMGSIPVMLFFGTIYTWATPWGELISIPFLGDFASVFTIPRALGVGAAVVAGLGVREKLRERRTRQRYEAMKSRLEIFESCNGKLSTSESGSRSAKTN